ncbi:hypothetical protein Ae706Ps2_5983c [Pseudonocardia sp. Ae706_Ps2]|nr:hypothetical protein Ae706Ps2_5983c [Pseudonocardia sp. Ae706_Ps2]
MTANVVLPTPPLSLTSAMVRKSASSRASVPRLKFDS